MAQKPDIQYIGQFYTYGSEARELARKTAPRKAAAKPVREEIVKVYVDPVALVGLVVAVALLIMMAVSTVQYVRATEACEAMEDYVVDLRDVNIRLTHDYLTGIDWEYVESTALAIGMVPIAEAETMRVSVTVPQPEPVPTFWENVEWFLDGLFA